MIVKIKDLLCILLVASVFSSCTKPDISFGEDYLDNNYTNIVVVDTATAAVSTVFIDSFATSATGKAVAGNYKDPYFGTVTAESYFPIAPPAFVTDNYSNTFYDSLEVIIKPNKSFYGDTTLPLQIVVSQLAEEIVYSENKTQLYNINSFPVKATPLGSETVHIYPSLTDSISIRLSDVIGNNLMSKLQNNDVAIQNADQFIAYFKGLRISAGNSNSFALGFSDSVIMRLHYSQKGVILQQKYADFTLSNKSLQFNHISVNRAGTALSALSSANNEIPSSATGNAGYLQTVTGSIVKISFPFLRNFLGIKNFLKIEKAELIVQPVKNSFNGFYPLPPFLRLSQTTQLNQLGTDITSNSAVENGNLSIDQLYGENTSYIYDITSYITTQIAIAANNKNGLLLSPPSYSFQSDFNRLLVGDKTNLPASIKLRLYYLTVNQN